MGGVHVDRRALRPPGGPRSDRGGLRGGTRVAHSGDSRGRGGGTGRERGARDGGALRDRRRAPGALAVWHDDARPLEPASGAALSTLAALATVALRNAAHHDTERNFYAHATNLLVSALDAHLAHQTDHSRRVAHLANRIGRRLALSDTRLERLHFAALLHDIGMLRVDPRNVGDRAAVRRHPELGAEMLKPIKLWEDLAPIVRHHHEWIDGGGYPDGLKGDRIPLESRIIAVAETYDALTSEYSYQQPIRSTRRSAASRPARACSSTRRWSAPSSRSGTGCASI